MTDSSIGGIQVVLPRVSIVIVHTSRPDLLEGCLRSIACSAGAEQYEVLVVDNVSGSGDIEFLVENAFPGTRLLRLQERSGLSRASNFGFRAARAELIFWLNDDTVLEIQTIDTLATFIESQPSYGVVAPKLLNADGTYQGSYSNRDLSPLREIAEQFGIRRFWTGGDLARSPDDDESVEQDALVVSGICMFRARALMGVGGLDERVFLYTEEFDICRMLKGNGWRIRYLPAAVLVHFGGASTGRLVDNPRTRQFQLQMILSRLAYYRKHYGNTWERIAAMSIFAGSLCRVFFYAFKGLFRADRIAYAQATFFFEVSRYCIGPLRRRADSLPKGF
jgi:GT2 family glycosyltransferase